MYCWFLQRESGAKHTSILWKSRILWKSSKKHKVFLSVNCTSRLIFFGGVKLNKLSKYYCWNDYDPCLLLNISKTFLKYCSGKVTMIIMPNRMHYFMIFSHNYKTWRASTKIKIDLKSAPQIYSEALFHFKVAKILLPNILNKCFV